MAYPKGKSQSKGKNPCLNSFVSVLREADKLNMTCSSTEESI